MFTFWNYYVLKLLRSETIAFSDAMLSDVNVVYAMFCRRTDRTATLSRYGHGSAIMMHAWPLAVTLH